ncbi:glutamate racemase [Arsenophonus symbiont of Ornithomya chloropus]|uniref:glutamate racemase n=1 Tax=Arsenophonus symbiont of Ornithomya chloropus TaxID=634121 RepID=UPI0032B262A5
MNIISPTILILDSGVGGLSVYYKVRELLPDINYIYVLDNEVFPYGNKRMEFITARLSVLLNKIQKKNFFSIAILACNTASTVSLLVLRNSFSFPIIGVVPAIKPAIQLTRNGIIGLLATKLTVRGVYTKNLIKKFAKDVNVNMIASSKLVQLAEKKIHGEKISKKRIMIILKPWLKMKKPPDTIILGCTHFPFLLQEFKKIFLEGTVIIDSNAAIARRAFFLMNNQKEFIKNKKKVMLVKNKNIVYCTKIDSKAEKLLPILWKVGFHKFQKIIV